MKLDELRSLLREMWVCPIWKRMMREQQASLVIVGEFIKDALAEVGELEAEGDGAVLRHATKVRQILHYVEHDRWVHLKANPRRTLEEGDPEYDTEAEGIKLWLAFLQSFNPEKTYSQCTALFHERMGYWPKWRWPGMPLDRRNMGRRIKSLRADELVPIPQERDDRRSA